MEGKMRIRKAIAIAATATLAFWTPSIIPMSIIPMKAGAQPGVGCGVFSDSYRTIDTAYASDFVPCPANHITPWPAIAVMVGVAGVMLNAAIVWNTQCRELTSQEAMTSAFLPLIGIAFNAQASKCKPAHS
jgi:hypothetical protein